MSKESIIYNNRNDTPAIRGTRLTVYSIMDFYFDGETSEAIAEFFRITPEEAQAAIEYINGHMAALMPHYQKMLERNRQGNSPEVEALLAKSHENLLRLKAEFDRKRAEAASARIAG